MKPLTLALALAASAALLPARAEDLVGVYRDALTSDPVFQSARAQYAAGLEKLPQARAGYLPLISGAASVFHNDVDFQNAPSLSYNTTTYAVTLSQPIFRLQNWIAIGQARQQVLQAEAGLAAAGEDLILRLAQAKRNFEVGTATIVDTLEAQARYDQASAKLISDKNDLEVKRRALLQFLGKAPEALAPLKDPLVLAPPQPADIETWVKAAEESSFTVVSAKANLEIAREEVDRQKAAHLPTLDATASWSRAYNPAASSAGIVGPITNNGSVGLTLSVPFYSGGLIQS